MACILPSSCLLDSSPSTSNSSSLSYSSIPKARSLWFRPVTTAATRKLNFPLSKRKGPPLPKEQLKWEQMMVEVQTSSQPTPVLQNFFKDGNVPRSSVVGTLTRLKQLKAWKVIIQFSEWLLEQGWYTFNQRDFFLLLLAYCKDGQVLKSEDLVERLHSMGVAPSIEMFTMQIEAYGRNKDLEKAESIFQRLLTSGPSPTALTYQTLMKSYSEAGRLEDVERLFKSVTESVSESKVESENGYVRPDARMYNLMLYTYGKQGRSNEALSVYRAMKRLGIQLTAVTFNSLLACQKTWRDAEAIFRKLRTENVAPDAFTYTILLNAYGKARKIASAQAVFNEMIGARVKPTQVAYNALINAYAKCKDPEGARMSLKEMKLSGCYPSVESYTSLVEAYASVNMMGKAEQAVLRMQEAGLRPNLTTFCVLMSGYASENKLENMMRSYDKMKLQGLQPNRYVYTVLINAYGSNDDFDAAVIWYKQMLDDGFKADPVLRNVLLKVAKDPEQRAEARELLGIYALDDASEDDSVAPRLASLDDEDLDSQEQTEDTALLVINGRPSPLREELVAT